MNGDQLRDKTTIETVYSILTGKNYTRAADEYDDTIGVEDILKDIDYDKKIDNLYRANQKTLKLVSNGLNKTFKENPKALGDFKKNLSDIVNPQQ
jgi:predicted hydrolase (HD superfamily)